MLRILRSPITTAILFIAAAALLGFGGIGAVQAAPRIQSGDYQAQVVLTNIHTSLYENNKFVVGFNEAGEVISGDNKLLKDGFAKDSDNKEKGLGWKPDENSSENSGEVTGFKIGATYKEELSVKNTGVEGDGGIPQFVRVTVRKYWAAADSNGKAKECNLDPELIDLNFVETEGWTIDHEASTKERTVLYYDSELNPGGPNSGKFTDTIRIKPEVQDVLANGDYSGYDHVEFRIEATVDAVQTHNKELAMTSAWGRTNA